ncbi:unnamed protein product, partial [Trichogramma brassicae]
MFVSQLVRLLDRPSKEAWETHTIGLEGDCSFDQLYEFLVSRIRAIERVDGKESANSSGSSPSKHVKANVGTLKPKSPTNNSSKAPSSKKQDTSYPCSLCEDPGHFIVACLRFKNLSLEERRNVVVNERLCYNCLGRHSVRNCKSSIRCKGCGQSHHTMIHQEADNSNKVDANNAKLSHHGSVHSNGGSLLATAMAHIGHAHENLKSATQLLIKLTQQHHFASEIQLLINGDIPRSHVFNRLTAFIDSQGIIR